MLHSPRLRAAAALVAAAALLSPRRAGAMFFTTNETHPSWDTWAFYEEGLPLGPFFEFYLASQQSTGTWSGFGVATSADGVHWTDQGLVVTRDANVTVGFLGTGSVWRAPANASYKFVVNYSQMYGSPTEQHIFFAVSDDLVAWRKLGWNDVFVVDASKGYTIGRWDCIYAIDDPALPGTGAKLGWWTTVPAGRHGFGFGASSDGVTWHARLPPLLVGSPYDADVEIGAVEALPGGGGKFFAMVGVAGQMLTFVADAPQGPFVLAPVNSNLLGHSPGAPMTTYFSRFFSSAPGPHVLVTHQWISRMSSIVHNPAGSSRCFLPPLKTAVVDAAGVLRLGWWPGNEAVRGAVQHMALESPPLGDVALVAGVQNISQGLIFELDVNTTSVATFGGVGLFVQTADGAGIAVLVVSAAGAGAVGPVQANGDNFKAEEAWDRVLNLPAGAVVRLRVLLRLDMIETYINDVFIATYSPASFPTGRIGVLDPAASVAGSAAAANASIWLMTLPGSGLAYQAPALASSIYQPGGDVYSAGRATDGDPATRWSSGLPFANSTAWLRIDLSSAQRVSEITIAWEEEVAFARAYSLQCARDDGAAQWTQLFETGSGAGGREVIGGLSADCRFVLLNCTQTGTTNGFSVYEIEVR